jgi:N-acetylglucosaminyl-diphospho-decaprenol L-rhamnosyltransferase
MTLDVSPQGGDEQAGPRVTALVVNYHAYAELDACLRSLERQPRLQSVVVVDQASDPAQRMALERRHPSVTWLAREDNIGFGAGSNLAARYASGDYLYLINPDAVAAPGSVSTLAGWLEAHPTVAVAGSLVRSTDGSIQGSARRFPTVSTLVAGRSSWLTRRFPGNRWSRRNVLSGPDVRAAVTVDWVSGASMMIRRVAFDEVAGFDERFFLYWEDADICRRLRTRGWLTAYVPDAEVVHHGSRSSGARFRPLLSFHRSALRYYCTHSGRLGTLASPVVAFVLAVRLAWKVVTRHRRSEAAQ